MHVIKKLLPFVAAIPFVTVFSTANAAIQEVQFQGEQGASYFTRQGIYAFLRYETLRTSINFMYPRTLKPAIIPFSPYNTTEATIIQVQDD